MRGRRVVLLLTGVLPLLADDDVPLVSSSETGTGDDENDVSPLPVASEALHDDGLQILPSLPLELMDLLDFNPSNIAMAEDVFDLIDEGYRYETEDVHESLLSGINYTPPHEIEDQIDDMKEVDVVDAEGASSKMSVEPLSPEINSTESSSNDANESAAFNGTHIEDVDETYAIADSSDDQITETHELHEELKDAPPQPVDDDDDDGPIERVIVDYASKSAGALILEKSPSMKGTSNLLNDDKDRYAIAPCQDKKFVVIGLSEDILVKQVRVANYERYSSHFETFQLLGSQTMGNWVDLGIYKAQPGNGIQKFDLYEPSWARYLKFRFLTHYGSEHYCTISQIMVHGSTMLQGFHEQWGDNEEENPDVLNDLNAGEFVSEGVDKPSTSNDSDQSSGRKELHVEQAGGRKVDPSPGVGLNQDAAISTQTITANDGSTNSVQTESPTTAEKWPTDSKAHESFGGPAVETPREHGSTGIQSNHEPSSGSLEIDGTPRIVNTTQDAIEFDDVSESHLDSDFFSRLQEETRKNMPDASGEVDSFVEVDIPLQPSSTGMSPIALSSASIEVSSLKSANTTVKHTTEELGTAAIVTESSEPDFKSAVASAVKAVVAEASDAIKTVTDAALVSGATKEIQERLKTAMGMLTDRDDQIERSAVHEKPSSLSDDTIEATNQSDSSEPISDIDKKVTNQGNATSYGEQTVAQHTSRDGSRIDEKPIANAVHVTEDLVESQGSSNLSHATEQPVAEIQSVTKDVEKRPNVEAKDEASGPLKTDPAAKFHSDISPTLSEIIYRFPSASCMEGLNYQEFKAKIIATRKGGSGSGGSQTGGAVGGPGKMEPIFKTLTDEIKVLQINQSVQDQYTRALVSCYQRVMFDMARELEDLQVNQSMRLASLEAAMSEMKSKSWTVMFEQAAVRIFSIGSMAVVMLHLWMTDGSNECMRRMAESGVDGPPALILIGLVLIGLVLVTVAMFAVARRSRTTLSQQDTPIHALNAVEETAVLPKLATGQETLERAGNSPGARAKRDRSKRRSSSKTMTEPDLIPVE